MGILPTRGKRVLTKNGSHEDAVAFMIEVAKESSYDEITRDFVFTLAEGYSNEIDQIKSVATFLFKNVYFEPDENGEQEIRSFKRMVYDGRGNCVDYSTALLTACYILGLRCELIVVAFGESPNFSHIYTLINDMVFDLVLTQNQKGHEFTERLSASFPKIGDEVVSSKQKIYDT